MRTLTPSKRGGHETYFSETVYLIMKETHCTKKDQVDHNNSQSNCASVSESGGDQPEDASVCLLLIPVLELKILLWFSK